MLSTLNRRRYPRKHTQVDQAINQLKKLLQEKTEALDNRVLSRYMIDTIILIITVYFITKNRTQKNE